MPLANSQIAKLLATKKGAKGIYEEKMNFVMTETDEPGFDVKEDWPIEFGNTKPSALYQGFRNAAEKLQVEDQVDVSQRDGTVYLLVMSRVAKLDLASTNGNHVNGDTDTDGNGQEPEDQE